MLDGLAAMGRTEDVRFAPGGRRLAVACYTRERIAVADVEITTGAGTPYVVLRRLEELSSSALREPHGLGFLDDETVIVANRSGSLAVFRIPPGAGSGEVTPVRLHEHGSVELLHSPGSVDVRPLPGGGHELVTCNNWADTVTRHTLDADHSLSPGEVAAQRWLDLPDGVAFSDDGQWLAVSNHNTHSVLVYECISLHEHADPIGVLRGVRYPHGLRFADDDRHLFVADAGAPHLHVFARSDDDWHGAAYPTATIRVMDDDTFARGHRNPKEGGPKGVDVHPTAGVVVVTAECLPLAFFDLAAALDREGEHDGVRGTLVPYELHALEERERIKDAAADAKAELAAFQRTKVWRLTRPARRVYAALLRLRTRW